MKENTVFLKNLAGNPEADLTIKVELELARIHPKLDLGINSEVPYSIGGELGPWTFSRAWYYWVAKAPRLQGLPLEAAEILHHKPYPIQGVQTGHGQLIDHYGMVVRAGGHAGGIEPEKMARYFDPNDRTLILDPEGKELELFNELYAKGLIDVTRQGDDIFITEKDKLRLVRKLDGIEARALVDVYHIDTQEGLNCFARTVKNYFNLEN